MRTILTRAMLPSLVSISIIIISCDDDEVSVSNACRFAEEPTFAPNDNALAPLVGIVRFTLDAPKSATIQISGGGETWHFEAAEAKKHRRVVLGLKPNTSYKALVFLPGPCGDYPASARWHTPRLPKNFPPLELITAKPRRMSKGMTLMNVRDPASYLIVVDGDGIVRWYYEVPFEKPSLS